MQQRFRTKVFTTPYTVRKKGRGTSTKFSQSRKWHQIEAPRAWNIHSKTKCKFLLCWGDPNVAKTHFALAFGEALPYIGNRMILVHTDNLVKQHNDDIEFYQNQNFLTNPFRSYTIQKIYRTIQKIKKGDIDNIDSDIYNFLMNVVYINVDECHKYGKGMDAKMFEEIMDFLFSKGNLKLILGTTATGKNINKIWDWAGTFTNRKQFTIRPNLQDLLDEGWIPGKVEYISVDTLTKVFDRSFTDSLNARIDDPNFEQHCQDLLNSDPDDAVDNLKGADHKLKFRDDKQFRIEALKYQDLRMEVSVDHWFKKEKGEPAMINVKGVNNAVFYSGQYEQKFKNAGYEIIHWNGEGKNNHPVYKNNEKKMLRDLFDPKHPLRVVITNGMLREGTNENFTVVYQCAFTAGGAETSVQLGNRAKYTVIMLDAMNNSKMPSANYQQALANALKQVGVDRTPQEIQEHLAAIQAEVERQKAKNPAGSKPDAELDINEMFESCFNNGNETTEGNTKWNTILSKDVWVYDVQYKGNHNTLPINNGSYGHQGIMTAIDILQEKLYA